MDRAEFVEAFGGVFEHSPWIAEGAFELELGPAHDTAGGLSSAMQDNQALQAAGLVGHSVLAVTDVGHLTSGGTLRGAIELATSAGNVQIEITDEAGQLVQTLELGQQPAGLVDFEWDGINAEGEQAAVGLYQVSARVIRGAETRFSAANDVGLIKRLRPMRLYGNFDF